MNSKQGKRSILSLSNSETTNITETTLEFVPINYSPNLDSSSSLLVLSKFKVEPCTRTDNHSQKQCHCYHNEKDRRRANGNYEAIMCPKFQTKSRGSRDQDQSPENEGQTCSAGDSCQFCHNNVELLYHESNYKRKFCSFFPNKIQNCEYGKYCSFAHSETSIRTELLHNYVYDDDFFMFHYKTLWCPFNLSNHNKAKCVYAHNLQDFRRKPFENDYDENVCSNWDCTSFIKKVEDGCKKGFSCENSHGWKEAEFHPLAYKVRPCLNANTCPRGTDCPFFHNLLEKRIIDEDHKRRVFKFHPRNRIIANTFKYPKEVSDEVIKVSRARKTVPSRPADLNNSSERRVSEQISGAVKVRFSGININSTGKSCWKPLKTEAPISKEEEKLEIQSEKLFTKNSENELKTQIPKSELIANDFNV